MKGTFCTLQSGFQKMDLTECSNRHADRHLEVTNRCIDKEGQVLRDRDPGIYCRDVERDERQELSEVPANGGTVRETKEGKEGLGVYLGLKVGMRSGIGKGRV